MELFKTLPEGFDYVKDEETYKLALLTFALAFGDNHYPIPSIPLDHQTSVKLWYDTCDQIFRHSYEHGYVLTNEDYSACIALSPMENRCDLNLDLLYDKIIKYADKEAADNYKAIFTKMGEGENALKYNKGDIFIELFAVTTAKQRQKLGSKLMRKLFEEADRLNINLFLATSTERNFDMYSHFGFELIKRDYCKELHALTYYLVRHPNKK